MNAHMRGWFLATSSINLAGSGVLMLRYGAYGLLMKMHLWLIEKRTQSTHQYLAFDCAIILSSTCFIIWISGYCVLHCIWIALNFFLNVCLDYGHCNWSPHNAINDWFCRHLSDDLYTLSFKFYMSHLSLLYPLHIYYFKGISQIDFLLVRPRWPCLIEWDLC